MEENTSDPILPSFDSFDNSFVKYGGSEGLRDRSRNLFHGDGLEAGKKIAVPAVTFEL